MNLSLSLTNNVRLSRASPYAAYALALDFDNADYWASGTRYAALSSMPGYAFARTGEQGAVDSDGTVDWFAANVPAINGNGYHAYGALTNIVEYSQQFNQWTGGGTKVTADATAAPDGTTAADKFVNANAAATDWVSRSITYSAGAATASVFAKAAEASQLWVERDGGINATFDLSLGTVLTNGGGSTGYIVDCGDGWYRCVMVWTEAGGAANIYIGRNAGTANGTDGIYLWQAQVIAGSFPDGGPLIRTTTAAASIGASALAVSLANGTYSATYTFDDDTTQNAPALVIADGTLNLPADFTPNRNIAKQLLIP